MIKSARQVSLLFFSSMLAACGPGSSPPQTGAANSTTSPVVSYNVSTTGMTARLSDATFNQLDPVEQYQVANKLYSTFYKGISVTDFFKLEAGLQQPETINEGAFVSASIRHLQSNLSDDDIQRMDLSILGNDLAGTSVPGWDEGRFDFSRDKPRELPLARIHVYPLSRQVYAQWMAWHLANSILFSPAAELDSADMTDAQNVFRRLNNGIAAGTPIRTLVKEHMRSEENWRRFRSPEDNTREMIEVFLGLFDRDAEVPAASRACQDLYLTDENRGYKLAYTDFPNNEPQQVLGSVIVNCDDFYTVVANHPNLLPTITATLVRYFFAGKDVAYQQNMVAAILASNPLTFEQLFSAIIFSEEYLLNNERLRSFEETFMATSERLRWLPRSDTFRGMASGSGGMSSTYMSEMAWPAMSAKLGRVAGVATDSLSFANFHKSFRERLLLDKYRWSRPLGLSEPETPEESDERLSQYEYEKRLALNSQLKRLTINELIDYLFISVVQRRATDLEKTELTALYDENWMLRHEEERSYVRKGKMSDLAGMTFDYLSRLSELYYFNRTTGASA